MLPHTDQISEKVLVKVDMRRSSKGISIVAVILFISNGITEKLLLIGQNHIYCFFSEKLVIFIPITLPHGIFGW